VGVSRRPGEESCIVGSWHEPTLPRASPQHGERWRYHCDDDDRRRDVMRDRVSRCGEDAEQHGVVEKVREHRDENPELDEQNGPEAGVEKDLDPARIRRPRWIGRVCESEDERR
jgi:hypothetical protein